MPAFAIISGYFSNLSKPWTKIRKDAISILLVYIIMQTLMTIIYGPMDLTSALLVPQYAMWYLIALPIWRILGYILKRVFSNTKILIAIGVIVALGSGFVPLSELGFQRICSFFPFFCLGLLFKEEGLVAFFRSKYKVLGLSVLTVLFIIFLIPNRMICSGMCNIPYNGMIQLLTRISVLFIGSIMSVAFFCVIPENRLLSKLGSRSLFFYCYHVFFVFHVIPWLWMVLKIQPNIIVIVVYSIIVFMILGSLSGLRILNKIIRPV